MATTTNFGWQTPDDTDLVKDGAAAIRTLGSSIDTSLVDLKGGTTGQVLSKNTNTDMDFTWVTTDDADAIQNSIVDAKGDLIAASANDTPARLAVGSNGDTLIADSAATVGLRYSGGVGLANPVINGGFDIWQRGTSISYPAGSGFIYNADRWVFGTSANQASTVSRQPTGDTTNLPNIQYCLRVQRNSGQTGTAANGLDTSFESVNSIPFAGKTVTLSFYARKGANYSPASDVLAIRLVSGTGTDQSVAAGFTGGVNVVSQNATLTSTWQRFTYTGNVGATATQLAIRFLWTPTGTAGADDYYEVTGVQLDVGSTALPFRRSGGTIQGELAACQRYYWRISGSGYARFTEFTPAGSATLVYTQMRNPVVMRVKPTAIDFANLAWWDNTSVGNAITALTINGDSNPYLSFLTVTTTGMTQYRNYQLMANNTDGYIGLSAEL